MGQVYLGRSVAGRLVAIKTIRPELAEEEGFRTRFGQEVAAARRVSGVFTAAVVEADADADKPWLATAYVPAPSLRRLVRTCGVLPSATVRWLAAGCAEALESIHGAGLVHLDLKPSNVLVAADGPRVIDFGVARAAARIGFAKGGVAKNGGAVGTPAYMAPEQARDVTEASPASDMFSLGGTLLFAATGHPPYTGETTIDILVRLATEPPDLAGLPEELAGLVVPCLDRSPRQRPSPTALLAGLGEFAEPRSYLPETALVLIQDYQRAPASRPADESGGDPHRVDDEPAFDTEQTAESYPGLPASARPEVPAPSFRSWRQAWREWLRLPAWAAWAIGGAILVAGGVVLGATLTSSGSPASSGSSGSSGSLGAGGGPPLGGPFGPACTSSGQVSAKPWLCVSQAQGGLSTVFTVRGSGFAPGMPVKLALSFDPPPSSPLPKSQPMGTVTRTASGPGGTLSWQPVQPGRLRLGLYTITASVPDGHELSAAFRVVPPGGPPPP
jgi:serine/threonine protein kinase